MSLDEEIWDITISGFKGTKYHKGVLVPDLKKSLKELKERINNTSTLNGEKNHEIINEIFGKRLI